MAALILWLFGIPIVAIIAVLLVVEFDIAALAVLAILLACALLFWSLTVEVTTTSIHLRFGVGIIRKSFSTAEVRRVYAVRNRWYYGLGIRRLPHGWLYCVSGLDAVEVEMANGQVHRIGTNRPGELMAAIREVQNAASSGSTRIAPEHPPAEARRYGD